jgi:hypothetical protein
MNRVSSLSNICISVLIVLFCLFMGSVSAQSGKASLNTELSTWKYADGSRTLIYKVTVSGEKGEVPVQGLNIGFFISTPKNVLRLGTSETATDGNAIFTLRNMTGLTPNSAGVFKFEAKSEENDKYAASERSVEVKDARVEIGFTDADSVRKITYSGMVRDSKGNEVPLANTDILLYVPRLFSMLKIADGWLAENGKGESVFPADLTGDSLGVVKIYARIEGSADFGNLEASGETDWAQKRHHEKREGPQRELWTPIAPLWMIITLIIMLTGVWAHYIYAIVQLVLINKAGKVKKVKTEESQTEG